MDYEDQYSTKLGAEVSEHMLQVTEKILQEASSNRPVLVRSMSQPVSSGGREGGRGRGREGGREVKRERGES